MALIACLPVVAYTLATLWCGLRTGASWCWPWKLNIETRHGLPCITRWRLLPSNPVFNIHLHRFHRGDDVFHDHPYPFVAFKLRGAGVEWIFDRKIDERNILVSERKIGWRPRYYGGVEMHQIREARGLWTLNIVGPLFREWGVIDEDGEWRPFRESVVLWRRNGELHSRMNVKTPAPLDTTETM